jgi:hypothetical protein
MNNLGTPLSSSWPPYHAANYQQLMDITRAATKIFTFCLLAQSPGRRHTSQQLAVLYTRAVNLPCARRSFGQTKNDLP